MDLYRRTQRVLEAVDRSEREARRAVAEDDRRDDHVQAIETARRQGNARECPGCPRRARGASRPRRGRRVWRPALCVRLSRAKREFDAGEPATRALRYHDDLARAVIGEQAVRRLESAARIDDDARGIGADDVTNRQSRVIRDRAADPDDDGVDEGAQPVQMRETGGSVDVAGNGRSWWRCARRATGRLDQ